VAVGPEESAHHAELTAAWNDELGDLEVELKVLADDKPLPRTFPVTARLIADRLRADFLAQELESLATVVAGETDPVRQAADWATPVRTRLVGLRDSKISAGPIELADMLAGSEVVGRQTVVREAERGTDTFARTVTHASATLTGTAASVKKPKAAVALVKALRGYAVLTWVLANFLAERSSIGRNLASLVIGLGGALVALAVVVPGLPIGIPLTGVVLVLATTTVSALRQRRLVGRRLAVRLGLLALVAAVALAGVLWQIAREEDQSVGEVVLDVVLRILLVAVVVGVGWFLGRPTDRVPAPDPRAGAGRSPGG
jgi:hypothetical protein